MGYGRVDCRGKTAAGNVECQGMTEGREGLPRCADFRTVVSRGMPPQGISMKMLTAALLCLSPVAAWAQAAPPCPTLPANAGLEWQQRVDAAFIACKAVAADGREVLNVMLTSRDPRIRLERRLREEESSFSGEEIFWYRPDLAGQETSAAMASRRITVVELDNDRYAQVWINANSPEELGSLISLAQQLDVRATSAQLSAGN